MTGNVADQPTTESHPLPLSKPEQPEPKTLHTRRSFLRGTAIAAAGLALYSAEISRHELSVLTHTLGVRNLPDAFHNFRIVQVSDIHFEEYTEPFFVRRVIDEVNRLQPDVILLTGDFITIHPLGRRFAEGAIYRCLDLLRGLKSPAFACMGNHDTFIGAPILKPIFASYGIPMLMNAYLPIERGNQRLWLGGVAEYLDETVDLDRTIPARPDGPVLLMCHCPDYADTILAHPRGHLVDLMFSGHTHGGQIRVPFLPPYHLPEGGKKYVEGLFRLNQMQLYVNKGIGAIGVPFRLNCPPEVTLFTLQNA